MQPRARCPRGHLGAVVLFTSVVCDVCEGRRLEYDTDAIRRFFAFAVARFTATFGRAPKEARIPPSWRLALASWTDAPPECMWAQLLDGEEGSLTTIGRDSAGTLQRQENTW